MFFKDFVSVKRQKIKRGASQTYDTSYSLYRHQITDVILFDIIEVAVSTHLQFIAGNLITNDDAMLVLLQSADGQAWVTEYSMAACRAWALIWQWCRESLPLGQPSPVPTPTVRSQTRYLLRIIIEETGSWQSLYL